MTNEEKIKKLSERMVELFGDKIPDPTVFPNQFDYYANLALYESLVEGNVWWSDKEPDAPAV